MRHVKWDSSRVPWAIPIVPCVKVEHTLHSLHKVDVYSVLLVSFQGDFMYLPVYQDPGKTMPLVLATLAMPMFPLQEPVRLVSLDFSRTIAGNQLVSHVLLDNFLPH